MAERYLNENCPRCCLTGSKMDFLIDGSEARRQNPDLIIGSARCPEQNPCAWRKDPNQVLEDHDMIVIAVEKLQAVVTETERANVKCRGRDAQVRPWKHWFHRPWLATWVLHDAFAVLGEVAERFGKLAGGLEPRRGVEINDDSGAIHDPFFDEAVKIVLGRRRVKIGELQQTLDLSRARWWALIDLMEQMGIVGAFNKTTGFREVRMTRHQYDTLRERTAADLAAGRIVVVENTDDKNIGPGGGRTPYGPSTPRPSPPDCCGVAQMA